MIIKVWDFPRDENLEQQLNDFIEQGKPICLLGHAVAVLIEIKAKNGDPLVKRRVIRAFSNGVEKLMGLGETPAFLLE
jgi:putative intracellular protease/amidase